MTRHGSPKTDKLPAIRCEPELRAEFLERCRIMDKVPAEVQRKLIERWLRETRAIERLKL